EAGQQGDADEGLERVAAAWAHRARTLAGDYRFAAADAALGQARALAPELGAVADAERRIERARQAHARSGSSLPAAERDRRVRRLLAEAADAEQRGQLLDPPGDSAFDKLRAARAIAPDDPAVRKATARLLPAARQCFERGLRDINLRLARACFDARVAVESDAAALAITRRRLAARWLAIGEERLGAVEVAGGGAELTSARALAPATPGLVDFHPGVGTATAPQRGARKQPCRWPGSSCSRLRTESRFRPPRRFSV